MAMNMRKWGSFAGGLSSGISSGLGTGNTLANSKQARDIAGAKEADRKTDRASDAQYYDDMMGLITGDISLPDFYKKRASKLAMTPVAQPMGPPAPTADAGAYTGPGLAEY